MPSSKCVLLWFFSIQLLKKTYPKPWNYSFLNQFPAQKALFKVPKICNIIFWIEKDPLPPLWNFTENSSDVAAPPFAKKDPWQKYSLRPVFMTSFVSAISISLFVQKIDPPIAGSSMPDYTLRLLLSTLFHTFSTFSCCVSLNFIYREFLDALASLKPIMEIKSLID